MMTTLDNHQTQKFSVILDNEIKEYILEVGRRRGLRGKHNFGRSLELLVQEHKEFRDEYMREIRKALLGDKNE